MVRPRSHVWKHFNVCDSPTSGKKQQAFCKYCDASHGFLNATRLTKHLWSCKKCPQEVKERYGFPSENKQPRISSAASSSEYQSTGISAASVSVVKSASLSSFVDIITPEMQQKIDEALARAVYATNTPFSLAENEHWLAAFKMLRPSYNPPSRYILSGRLLDAEYELAKTDVQDTVMKATCLTVLTDGWTNIRGESIVNFVVTTPKPVFYKSVDTGTNRHTAAYISSEISNVIDSLQPNKVVALVTDNASNMQAACQKVVEKFPHIATMGCAAHGLNLLLNDIMRLKVLERIYETSRKIIKYVKHTHVVAAALLQKQESKYGKGTFTTLKLASKTRWGGVTLSLQSLLNNKEALQETVIVEDIGVAKPIRQAILDEEVFWKDLRSCLDLVTPVSSAITKLESDQALLSDVVEVFHSIKSDITARLENSSFTEDEKSHILRVLRGREEFCLRPIHIAANFLDPRYRGKNLADAQIVVTFDWISQHAKKLSLDVGKILSNVAQYRTCKGIWSSEGVWESAKHLDPSTWWEGLCFNEPLNPIAGQILQIPPSSAACERNWSEFGNVHTKLRNRLSGDRVQKLVYVHSNLNVRKASSASQQRIDVASGTESDTD